MLTDIPKPEQFHANGFLFLNLAWDIVSELYMEVSEIGEWELDFDEEYENHTLQKMAWEEASHRLSNSLVLVQQGLEFLLKSNIAEVSPYLLISNSPRDWPNKFARENTSFSEFRTVDAQDLVKLHNTVCIEKLGDDFTDLVDSIRTARNSVMHSVGSEVNIKADEVWKWILEILLNICNGERWISFRRSYLSKRTHAFLNFDYVEGKMAWEGHQLLRILNSTERKKHLNVTKARRYICNECTYAMQSFMHTYENIKSAQLYPNTPKAKNLTCFICGANIPVFRRKCIHEDCPGNVIDEEMSMCLKCGRRCAKE